VPREEADHDVLNVQQRILLQPDLHAAAAAAAAAPAARNTACAPRRAAALATAAAANRLRHGIIPTATTASVPAGSHAHQRPAQLLDRHQRVEHAGHRWQDGLRAAHGHHESADR